MESHEVLRKAFKKVQPKKVAQELKLSQSLIHQWQRPRGRNGTGRKGTGALNPLDRTAELMRVTGDLSPLHWLCQQHNGYFVHNPAVVAARPATKGSLAGDLPAVSLAVLKDMGEMESALADALSQRASLARVEVLRVRWEGLKSNLEQLVRLLENGDVRRQLLAWFIRLYSIWDAATPGGLI